MRTLLAVLALTAVVVAPAGASTRAERVAAADAFARRTASLYRQVDAADARAKAALKARRDAAQGCLSVFQSSPSSAREELADVYFAYLSGALWSVDRALYGAWVADLRRSKRIDRAPVLARGADSLRTEYRIAEYAYRAFPDACATATAWRDAGWSPAVRPLTSFEAAAPRFDERRHERIQREAVRQLDRYSRLWDQIGTLGIDEVDARVHATTGCDGVGKLLFPSDYEC